MATELPVKHLSRLIDIGLNHAGSAAKISARLVQEWLSSLNGEDPVQVLNAVMSGLSHLPCHAKDFLGEEVYSRVERVRNNIEDDDEEDDGSDFEDEDDA